jgi:trehalose 6-phosphate synthase/phosphatase
MKPIVIVSHSLPFWVVPDEKTGELRRQPCATGLATVLAPFVAKTSDTCWIGWCGREFTGSGMKIPESAEPTSISHGIKSSQIVLAPFIHQHQHHKVHARFLNGMCHSSLWPLLHSMPIYAQFSLDHWQAYVEVNSEFAKTTMTTTLRLMNEYNAQNAERKNRALIWIHDYHLMLMPSMLRSRLDNEETATIAFFLHTPFPAWDVFRLCPWSKELLLGLVLGCSLVAFHTNMYANNFMECCWHVLGAKIDRVDMSIEYGNKTTMIRALPVGIPFNWFENKSREAPVEALKGQEKVILGVDRFDYTKGKINLCW